VVPTALAAYGAGFTLDAAAARGSTQVVVTGAAADITLILNRLPPAPPAPAVASEFLAIDTGTALEYAFAIEAHPLTATRARLVLSAPLRLDHVATAGVVVNDPSPAGSFTNDTLALAANGGDLLVYPNTAPPPGDFAAVANAVIFEPGTATQEAQGIGALAALPLDVPAYALYPSGTFGQLVTVSDDVRHVAVVPVAPFTTVALDDVDGLAVGMTLTFIVAGNPESSIVDAIDAGASPSTVTLRTALTGAPLLGSNVSLAPKTVTTTIGAGAVSIPLNDRLGLAEGDVIRIGAGGEIAVVREIVGERGAPPDAGSLILNRPLGAQVSSGTLVQRQAIGIDPVRQPLYLVLAAVAGADEAIVNDGTGYVLGEVVRLTLPDGSIAFHSLSANAVALNPGEIELDQALAFGHDAGLAVVERSPLLEIRALDAGDWGNRLLASCREEASGLASNARVLNANPPPGPGMFSSLQLSSITGVEPGTVLEVLDPAGNPANLALLKVRRVDRPTRLALLDAPGLQAAHMTAHNNALLAGENLRVRSREFSLMVMLRQRPDPAVPTRDDDLLDQEVFRHLSMDPRHSRYVMRLVGATWTVGNPVDDLNLPLRRWDRRSEGASSYVRVLDLEASGAAREAIRLGPEALVDVMPSGLQRPARHPFGGGNDAVVMMNDAMYAGTDSNEPDLRTGIYTMKNLLNVSLVAIPGQASAALQQALIDHCEEMRYRFAVLDGPPPLNDTLVDVQNHRQQYDTKYAALYHPWLTIPDPFPTSLATTAQYPVPPSGHVLGIYARVDNERGVHKAPANEVVRNITGLTRYFTKGEQDILNPYPVNINVVRDFRVNNRAIRVWGARCITSDNDHKYVNVRRLLIFIEDSVDRGLQWVVFEPNAEELWARVRRSVANFLTTVWRNGALEGATVDQAFFVKCDRTTMTRDDIDNGRLICVIGVAPVKPAEFVIIRIGLWTADAQV
jgi:hypothetical protein